MMARQQRSSETGRGQTMINPERPHGAAKYVTDRCRCDVCRAGKAADERWRRAEKKAGRVRWVNAEPVRQHVQALMLQGMGWVRVSRAAGVADFTVSYLLYGDKHRGFPPARRVSVMTAKKLLAVQFDLDALSDRTLIDATGVRRRVQALFAAGWTMRLLADELGVFEQNLRRLFTASKVRVSTHRAVVALHQRLWQVPPSQETARQRADVQVAKRRAVERGYVPTAAWDDIDNDPEPNPGDGEEILDEVAIRRVVDGHGDGSILTEAEKVEAARIMVTQLGWAKSATADHLGMGYQTVKRLVA